MWKRESSTSAEKSFFLKRFVLFSYQFSTGTKIDKFHVPHSCQHTEKCHNVLQRKNLIVVSRKMCVDSHKKSPKKTLVLFFTGLSLKNLSISARKSRILSSIQKLPISFSSRQDSHPVLF